MTVQRLDGEFGFRIHGSRPVVVSAIEPGTPAETSGLTVGDILLTINGVNVLDLPHTQVVRVAQRCSEALELGVARMDDVMERASVWQQLDMAKEVLAQGYLYKKKRTSNSQSSQHQHHWVTRWFVLRADDCLYSFKSENVNLPHFCRTVKGFMIFIFNRTPGQVGRCCYRVVSSNSWILQTDKIQFWLQLQDTVCKSSDQILILGRQASGWLQILRQNLRNGRKCFTLLPTKEGRR